MTSRLLLPLLAVSTLASTGPAAAQAVEPKEQAKLEVGQKEDLGKYLTDAEGRSLYLFEADSERNSNCYDACADAWPPLLTKSEPQAGEGIDKTLIGTIEREGTEGAMQVIYAGWPLYYFARDEAPGDTKGQDIEGFGAEWYLLTPEGEKVYAEGGEKES
jgi:predicted lipoprotein with Yx(FWY)xxD motif